MVQRKIISVLLPTLLLMACSPTSNGSHVTDPHVELGINKLRMNVIYGDDNRKDLYQVTDSGTITLAMSTVALMHASKIEPVGANSMRIKGLNYGQAYGLCKSEPFYDQNYAAFCSGFLVGPETIITAGHCINKDNCADTKFVFGFAITKAGQQPYSVPNDNVYSCKTVIQSQQVYQNGEYGPDFAVVTLDRSVMGFRPLNLRQTGQIQKGEPVMVIGHPAGLPTKVADGANVRDSSKIAYFSANLDTYGGNSGSAVFNLNTGVVEGILVRGEVDYVNKKGENCNVSNVCSNDGCMGEQVTRIEYARPYIH